MRFLPYLFLLFVVSLISLATLWPERAQARGDYHDYLVVMSPHFDFQDVYLALLRTQARPVSALSTLPFAIRVESDDPAFIEQAYANGAWFVLKPVVSGGCIGQSRNSFVETS